MRRDGSGGAAMRGGGGEGGAAGRGGGAAATGASSRTSNCGIGTVMRAPQAGHLPALPAHSSFTLKVFLHPPHVTAIATRSLLPSRAFFGPRAGAGLSRRPAPSAPVGNRNNAGRL